MTTPPPRRNVQLIEGFEEMVVAGAQLARRAGADEFELAYEAAYAPIGADADPRGDDDLIRWVAKAGYHVGTGRRQRTRWVLGASADVPYLGGARHEEAITDAIAAMLRELGANVRIATLRGDR